jgi:hypothetical protein
VDQEAQKKKRAQKEREKDSSQTGSRQNPFQKAYFPALKNTVVSSIAPFAILP